MKSINHRFFPHACKLIHDELQLKGWESPSVMFLYSLGIAVGDYQVKMVGLVSLKQVCKMGPRDNQIYAKLSNMTKYRPIVITVNVNLLFHSSFLSPF